MDAGVDVSQGHEGTSRHKMVAVGRDNKISFWDPWRVID